MRNMNNNLVQVETHVLEEMKAFMLMRSQYYDAKLDSVFTMLQDRSRTLDIRFDGMGRENELRKQVSEEHFLTVEKAASIIRDQLDERMEYAERNVQVLKEMNKEKHDMVLHMFIESEQALQNNIVLVKEKFQTLDIATDKRFNNVIMMSDLMLANINIRFTDVEKASTLYTGQLERRFDLLNTFTTQFTSELSKYPTRQEIEAKYAQGKQATDANTSRLGSIEQRIANFEGRLWAISVGFTFISVAITIALHFIPR